MQVVAPEEVGFSAPRFQRLTRALQGWVDAGEIPGALMLVARRGQAAYCEALGYADIAGQRQPQADTLYRIYSMTKPITSLAVMLLSETGQLLLEEPVAKYIPEFADLEVYEGRLRARLARPITIKHLLTHTAGLTYDFLLTSPVDRMYAEGDLRDRDVPLDQWVKRLAKLPLVSQPGTRWRYSVATDVLGYLVQAVSGQPFDAFLRERIFEPLRMHDTGFYVPAGKTDRLAKLYGSGMWEIGPEQTGDYTQPPVWLSGGGGLVSSLEDYLRFCLMLRNGGELDGTRLVGRKTVELMTMNHIDPAIMPLDFDHDIMLGQGFGLGFSVVVDPAAYARPASAGTYGWGGAAYTNFWIDPVEDLIAIFMTQVFHINEDSKNVDFVDIHARLRPLVYQALVD
jgi:CubicO group peptidase (beta-lactamase class C family)